MNCRGCGAASFTYVDVLVRGAKGSKAVKMLVDTGSTYVVLDPTTVRGAGPLRDPVHRRAHPGG
ncbi:hypothetical protein [Thermofilum pendens]|uniref:hypothetical protein n=1 Tax=Thermofilum pendens TaxID=2269 RepID=UPI00164F76DA|nr:hypothetical protein [Thermofilum pendens]